MVKAKSTDQLVKELRYCDKRWEKAMAHPGYKDEPAEDKPFTPAEEVRMFFAEGWRTAFHVREEALYQQRDVRHGLVEGLATRTPFTIYEPH